MNKLRALILVVIAISCAVQAQETNSAPKLLASAAGPKLLQPAGELSLVAPAINLAAIAPVGEQHLLETARQPMLPRPASEHKFLDKENLALFATVSAARAMDLVSTWQFRRHGLHEAELSDSFVDNKPLFTAFSASMVAGQITSSYMFHRLGWHKMERITALVHTGVVTGTVVHNYQIGYKH